MRSIITVTMIIFSVQAASITCDITGEYRCRGGRVGSVLGQGKNEQEAKIRARDLAREICGGRVDYVRFIEDSSTC